MSVGKGQDWRKRDPKAVWRATPCCDGGLVDKRCALPALPLRGNPWITWTANGRRQVTHRSAVAHKAHARKALFLDT
jgi:hypothetical protein